MQGYCIKCKAKRVMILARSVKMKNGRPATKGNCSKCGTRMFSMGKDKSLTQ